MHVYVIAGHSSNHTNTFHLHGYNFLVLSSKSLDRPVDVAEVKLNDSLGLLSRNLKDAPRKDTVVVPNKGYTIIRLFTDNPGWLHILSYKCT
jgi:FtsP/CotA-like multicopper oxidase with cupredoxin domain